MPGLSLREGKLSGQLESKQQFECSIVKWKGIFVRRVLWVCLVIFVTANHLRSDKKEGKSKEFLFDKDTKSYSDIRAGWEITDHHGQILASFMETRMFHIYSAIYYQSSALYDIRFSNTQCKGACMAWTGPKYTKEEYLN